MACGEYSIFRKSRNAKKQERPPNIGLGTEESVVIFHLAVPHNFALEVRYENR